MLLRTKKSGSETTPERNEAVPCLKCLETWTRKNSTVDHTRGCWTLLHCFGMQKWGSRMNVCLAYPCTLPRMISKQSQMISKLSQNDRIYDLKTYSKDTRTKYCKGWTTPLHRPVSWRSGRTGWSFLIKGARPNWILQHTYLLHSTYLKSGYTARPRKAVAPCEQNQRRIRSSSEEHAVTMACMLSLCRGSTHVSPSISRRADSAWFMRTDNFLSRYAAKPWGDMTSSVGKRSSDLDGA